MVIGSCDGLLQNGKEMHKKNVMHVQSCYVAFYTYCCCCCFDVLVAVASLDLRVLDVSCETRGSDVIVRFDVGVT